MHDIEPYYHWRDQYISAEDDRSPFFGRVYDEFTFRNKIYNYFIHPQWDGFGSATLYTKILYADYDEHFAIMEFIGEWNDCLSNDIMFLKRDVVDEMKTQGITKFILVCENVLNFHGSDNSYYEEWYDDVVEEGGWITFINTLDHVSQEMADTDIQFYASFGTPFNNINWRTQKPKVLYQAIESLINGQIRRIV